LDQQANHAVVPGPMFRAASLQRCLVVHSWVLSHQVRAIEAYARPVLTLCKGYLTDKLGRRRSIQIGCAIWIIGSIICAASQNIGMLIAGRFINGVAVGICSAQVPVYVTELAPPSKRGRVVGSQQWAITWGILIMVSQHNMLIMLPHTNTRNSTTSPTAAHT
jgi:fucose permease